MIHQNRNYVQNIPEEQSCRSYKLTECSPPEVSPTQQRTKRKYVRKKALQPKKTRTKDSIGNQQSYDFNANPERIHTSEDKLHHEEMKYRVGHKSETSSTSFSSNNNPQRNPRAYGFSNCSLSSRNQPVLLDMDHKTNPSQPPIVPRNAAPHAEIFVEPNNLAEPIRRKNSFSENTSITSTDDKYRNRLNSITIILYQILEACLAQIDYEPNDLKHTKFTLRKIRDYFILKYGSQTLGFDRSHRSDYRPYENVRSIMRQKIFRNTSLIRYYLEQENSLTDTVSELKHIEGIDIEMSFHPNRPECEKTWNQLVITYHGLSTTIIRIQEDPMVFHRLNTNHTSIFASFEEGECLLIKENDNRNQIQRFGMQHQQNSFINSYNRSGNQFEGNSNMNQRDRHPSASFRDVRPFLSSDSTSSNANQGRSGIPNFVSSMNNQTNDLDSRTSVIMRPWDNGPQSSSNKFNYEVDYRIQCYQNASEMSSIQTPRQFLHEERQVDRIINNEYNQNIIAENQQIITSNNRYMNNANQAQNHPVDCASKNQNAESGTNNNDSIMSQNDSNKSTTSKNEEETVTSSSSQTNENSDMNISEATSSNEPNEVSSQNNSYNSKLLRKIILEIREVGKRGVTTVEEVVSYILLSVIDSLSPCNQESDQDRAQVDEDDLLNNPEMIRISEKIMNKMRNRNIPKEQRMHEVRDILTKILQSQLKQLRKSLYQSQKATGVVIKQEILDLTQDSGDEENYDDLPELIRLEDAIRSGKFTDLAEKRPMAAQTVSNEDIGIAQAQINVNITNDPSSLIQESLKSIKPSRSPSSFYLPKEANKVITVNNQNKIDSGIYQGNIYNNFKRHNYEKAYIPKDPFNNPHIHQYAKQRGISLKHLRHLLPNGMLHFSNEDNILYRFLTGEDYKKWLENPNKLQNFAVGRQLPSEVVFCDHDLLTAVEYVREIRYVQHYVPKDFGNFYDYITRSKIQMLYSPVSFCKFLAMYNTNQLDEEAVKYIIYLAKTSLRT